VWPRLSLGAFQNPQRLATFACATLLMATVFVRAETKLEACGTIPLPGVEGRFDHFAADAKGQRLFLAALGNNSLEIIGLREGRRLQSIPGMKKPQGVAYVARLNSVFVANGDDGTVRIYDGGNYQPKQIIPGLDDADNLRYDPIADRVYVGYGKGGIGAIQASSAQVLSMIKLRAHPESFQLDDPNHTLYVNVPDAKQVTVVDLNKHEVLGSWPLERFQANFPMALDVVNRRLFVGCRRPARLLVLDTQSGKPVMDLPIAGDTDDLFYDAKRKRIYVSCGEGFIDILGQNDPGHYVTLERIPTAAGARTSFFSPDLDLFALAVPHQGKQNAEVRIYQPK
jgi:hypothetical protein